MAIVISILIVLALDLAAFVYATGTRYVGLTQAGWTWVHNDSQVEGKLIRVLEVQGTYQSATFVDHRWADPVFPYHLLFDRLFDAWPQGDGPTTMAILGGGGYAIPKHVVAHHPQVTRIDVVEIDPAIERLARRHFFLNRLEQRYGAESSGRLRLHLGEAHRWLTASDQRFDVILNDCFFGFEPETSLMDDAGAKLIHQHLSPGGLYLSNVISSLEGADSQTLYRVIGALRSCFAYIWVLPCSPNHPSRKDNNVVIASDARHAFEGAWEWPA